MAKIRGAGGKSGGGGLTVDADTLRSLSFATADDLIGEGEIAGLVNGAQSIYLDGTPLQNPDGSYNFRNVQWDFRAGTQGQTPIGIPGTEDVETEFAVSAEFTNVAPVIRTITNPNCDECRVTISLAALQVTDANGVHGTEVDYAIDVQSNGGGFVQVIYQQLIGKSSGAYERTHRFKLTGSPPWDIRCRRITPDNHSSVLQNETYWASYTEIEDVLLNYPNTARAAVRVDASQFSSIPQRSFVVNGLIVPVPTNYDPLARTYTGVWDGTFKMAFSNNPAWCFLVLLTNQRFGLGTYIDVGQIDKWALYQIAQYCDGLVPDGKGGMEPRFTCSVYMQDSENAYNALNNLASIFRGMIYYGAGTITASQDAPNAATPPLFTNANVIDGLFAYQGGDRSQRHTVALVSWVDPSNSYKSAVEYVPDADGIARYGIMSASVTAVGCHSQGQAHRVGRWLLYTNQNEAEVVTFSAALEGAVAAPGQIIQIADLGRAGKRIGGRIVDSSANTVTLDSPVSLTAGQSYTLYVINGLGAVESQTVTTAAGSGISTLTTPANWTSTPKRMAVWMLSSDELSPQLFRVVSVSESRDDTSDNPRVAYQYTAVPHNPSKYDYVENLGTLQVPNISLLTALPAQPQNVHMFEAIYALGATQASQVTIGCDSVPNVVGYLFRYQINQDTPIEVQTHSNSLVVSPAPLGNYQISVYAIGASGRRSIAGTGTGVADGVSDAPPPLDGLNGTVLSNNQLQLSWTAPTDPAVTTGGFIQIRYSTSLSGADWGSASIVATMSGASQQATVPLMGGTYLAKPITYDNVESADAVFLVYNPSTGGTLAGSASPSAIYMGGAATSKTTAQIVFSASGGTPPYTHSIAYSSGSTSITITTPAGPSTAFSASSLATGESRSAIFIDTITDSAMPPATTTVTVNVTIAQSTPSGGGGGRTGGGACVVVESYLLDGSIAGDAIAGSMIATADEHSLETSLSMVDAASTEIVDCVRIETDNGASLICSLDAPLPTFDVGLVRASQCLGYRIAIRRGKKCAWEQVVSLDHVGRRSVRKITVGNRSFWAGEQPDVFVLHHNIKEIP